ncbi:MAG: formyltransferase family protein [Patescibacteria group bacterium]
MKIVIFTSNALRHKYIANTLAQHADEFLVISECKPYDGLRDGVNGISLIDEHFALRARAEKEYFGGCEAFRAQTIPLLHKEANLLFVYDIVERYGPDAGFVFGSSIIKEPLLSLMPRGKFVNLHLGLSPYYRGSGTNFWPLVNKEPEYVGATLLHIDAGIDTGNIITHVRPHITADDTVHTLGNKTIIESGKALVKILELLKNGKNLPRTVQWKDSHEKFYKKANFSEEALKQYRKNIDEGLLKDYVRKAPPVVRLVEL